MSEAGPNQCGPGVESDADVTTGGILGRQPQLFLVPQTTICGGFFSLYPTTCFSSCYSSRRTVSEWGHQEERVKTIEEGGEEKREEMVSGGVRNRRLNYV